jgi:hypothetical protein
MQVALVNMPGVRQLGVLQGAVSFTGWGMLAVEGLQRLSQLRELTLGHCQLQDAPAETLQALGRCSKLRLACSSFARDSTARFDLLAAATDLSLKEGRSWRVRLPPLCRQLQLLHWPHLSDLSALTQLEKATIVACPAVTDVAPLARVKEVFLEELPELEDVSPLRECSKLSLVQCPRVSDVSCLGRVHTLLLSHLPIQDVQALSRCRDLTLVACHGVADIAALAAVPRLTLTDCEGITNVAVLAQTSYLDLLGCPNILDCSMLGRVPRDRLPYPTVRPGLVSRWLAQT